MLFTHPQLLGKGLTFTNCNYNIYNEIPIFSKNRSYVEDLIVF